MRGLKPCLVLLFTAAAGCSRGKPAAESAARAETGHADGGVYRLRWKLPAGRRLRYVGKHTVTMPGRDATESTFEVEIVAPRDGTALLDMVSSLSFGDMQTILSEAEGLNPYGALGRDYESALRGLFPLPPGDVAVGDSWTVAFTLYADGKAVEGKEREVVFSLRSVDPGQGSHRAMIETSSNISYSSEGDPKQEVHSVSQGRYVFDIDKGCFAEAQSAGRVEAPLDPSQKRRAVTKMEYSLVTDEMMPKAETDELSRRLAVREVVHRGFAMARKGEHQRALAELKAVADTEFEGEHVHLAVAGVYVLCENWEEAERACQRELRQFPDNLQALLLLERVYEQMGERDKAQDLSRRFDAAMQQRNLSRPTQGE